MKIKYLFVLCLAFLSSFAFANDKQTANAAITAACSADAKTAGCGDKQAGSGLLRCLHEYKKSHKDFALSAGCKTEIEKHRKPAPKSEIDAACADDAKTASCGDKKVGSGLLRCLHEYKKSHKDFALSSGCKAAIDKRKAQQKNKEQ
jgi:hypothetical protein